jgi:polyhydroxybutyrate depolymerase
MSATADAHGFAVAYPAGLSTSWNAGICCGAAAVGLIDDVGFARAVVADASGKLCIDEKRVYSTGMSNGGYLSHRNGCESADLFAAIAPVAGVIGIPQQACAPSRPVPVIHFYGTADSLVPYAGGGALGSPSVADTDAGWAARNGCTGAPVTTYQQGLVHCETHEACDAGTQVTLCTVEGGGHCWPGQAACPFGWSTTDISANDAMWEFFQGFSLP